MSPETSVLGTSTWRSADPCPAPDSCLGLLGAELGSVSQRRPPTTPAAGQWEGSHAIHRETGPAYGAEPPCPQPHPPCHSPRPTRPWPHTFIHQGHPAQVLALSLCPSHRCPLPSRLPPSIWHLHTYCGRQSKPAADKGCLLGVGVAVGGVSGLRAALEKHHPGAWWWTPCGVGQVCSTRCPCPACHASVSLGPASTSLETRWGVQALPQAVIGGGRDEPGALQGHVPMGAEAHDIGDPSALVFGAGHE